MNRSTRSLFVLFVLLALVAMSPVLAQQGNDDDAVWGTSDAPVARGEVLSGIHATEDMPGNEELTLYVDVTLQGGVASAGVSLRGVGAGDITIADVPAGATVEYAFLYWETIGQVETTVTFDGNTVTGEHIGTSANTCWSLTSQTPFNFAVRADVTEYVSGNGTYNISGLPIDPDFGSASFPAESQGASLVIIYSVPDGDWVNIVIHDGSLTVDAFSQESTTMAYVTDAVPPTFAELTVLVGDGQTGNSELLVNATSFPNLFGTGDLSMVLWDTLTLDVAALLDGTPVDVTLNTDTGNSISDCLVWEAAILEVSTPQPFYDTCNGYDATIWVDGDGIIQVDEAYYGGLPVPRAGQPYDGRLIGTDRPDVIAGTREADYINGRANNDIICGYDEDDVILGVDGQDDIWGGDGNDEIDSGVAGDEVWGEAGDDTILLGEGTDYAEGGEGNDTITDGDGQAEIYGGPGDDMLDGGLGGDERIYGGDGSDTLYSGAGNDYLYGETGMDLLVGGQGDDRLYGGDDTDELHGMDNNDWMYGEGGDGDLLFGGDGDDRLSGGDGDADQCIGQAGPHDSSDDTCEIADTED